MVLLRKTQSLSLGLLCWKYLYTYFVLFHFHTCELTNALDAVITGLKEIANSIDFTYLHFSVCRISLILNFFQELWNGANKISKGAM